MKAERETVVTIILTLEEAEALWLRAIMQNPLAEFKEQDYIMQEAMFNQLNVALRK